MSHAPASDVYLFGLNQDDVNQKILRTNGEFVHSGKHLAWGVWVTPTRYTAYVSMWGGWWVGETMADGTGMKTTMVKDFAQVATVNPGHEETFRPKQCVVLQSGKNQKVLTPDGKFFVQGQLLGTGSWVSPTRFAVEISMWGGWWVGVVVNQGMKTMIVKNKSDIEGASPQHMELGVRCMDT